MIPPNIKEQVLERTDLVALIGQSVQLRKSGSRFVGCCPFHQEKTPSFYVFPQTGTFKCFGCGEGGDAISFLQRRDGLNFTEAVKTLGKSYGIDVEEEEEDAQAKQQRMHIEALQVANEQVAAFYRKQFEASKEAQAYAFGRWGEEYCKLKDIGFSPKGGRALLSLGIKKEFLKNLDWSTRVDTIYLRDVW